MDSTKQTTELAFDDDIIRQCFIDIDHIFIQAEHLDDAIINAMRLICELSGSTHGLIWDFDKRSWKCKHKTEGVPNSLLDDLEFAEEVAHNIQETAEYGLPDIYSPGNKLLTSDAEPDSLNHHDGFIQEYRQLVIPISICGEIRAAYVLFERDIHEVHESTMEISRLTSIQQRLECNIERFRSEQHVNMLSRNLANVENELKWRSRVLKSAEIIGRNLNEKQVAYDVVNEVYSHFGEGRVSLAIRRGKKCTIKAISNQQIFDKRSAQVLALQRLASVVGNTGHPLSHPTDSSSLPDRINKLFAKYYETADSQSITLLPLTTKQNPGTDPNDLKGVVLDRDAKKGLIIGVIVVEGLSQPIQENDYKRTWALLEPITTNAVGNARRYSGLFLMPVWRLLGIVADLFRGHHRNKAILAMTVLLVLSFAFVFVETDFRIRSKGVVQPTSRARIYAKADGAVAEMFAVDGDWVERGQILARLDNPKLNADIAEVEGELGKAIEKLKTLKLQRMSAKFKDEETREKNVKETAGLQASVDSLRKKYSLLLEKRSHLLVKSPLRGQVVSWDLPRRLFQRPIKRGQRLMTVADTRGDWELELRVPDQRSGYLHRSAEDNPRATFVFSSHPTTVYEGSVRQIARSADVDEEDGNVVRVYVDLNKTPDELGVKTRPGTEVVAHVHAGRASVGYCKLYELIDWGRRTVFTFL